MSYRFTVIINEEEDWYVATCAENDITSQGKTIDEALKNLKEAIELYFEDSEKIVEQKQTFVTTMEVVI